MKGCIAEIHYECPTNKNTLNTVRQNRNVYITIFNHYKKQPPRMKLTQLMRWIKEKIAVN